MSVSWTHCPICRSENIITVEGGIGKCNECGHKFRISAPEDILSQYFDKQYWSGDKNRQGMFSVKPDEHWTNWVNGRLEILESFGLVSHADPGKVSILEFGCAEGMLLYTLKKRGYHVVGNDVCAIVDESVKELGIEVFRQPVEEFSKSGRKFDLIMSFHVIEHLRDPRNVMENLSKMLLPGGMMLMHVPVDDVELDNATHLHFFSNESCLKLMEQITTDIRSDFVMYPSLPGGVAVAATYVGRKKEEEPFAERRTGTDEIG